jgi:hypothetical protein
MQREFGVGPNEEVIFTQLTAQPYPYRDAVRFDNGSEVLLQKLEPGQRAVVLRLALAEEVADPETAYAALFWPRRERLWAPRSIRRSAGAPNF